MVTSQFSVDGEVAIVTGASRGIGREIAERFAHDGATVVLCSRDIENVQPVAEAITESDSPGHAVGVECNVRDKESVENLMQDTIDMFGSIDVLINNAGGSFQSRFEDISENGWKTLVEINLHGTYNCTHAAGSWMLESDGGVIVNMASIRGVEGAPLSSPYGAAKAGIINFTRTLAYEWAQHDIRVNCIAPGFIATPGVLGLRDQDIEVTDIDRDTVDRELGRPEEISDVVQFLASPAASFMTGETVTVRGVPRIIENPREFDM